MQKGTFVNILLSEKIFERFYNVIIIRTIQSTNDDLTNINYLTDFEKNIKKKIK